MGSRVIIIIAILMLTVSLCINAKQPPADLGYDPPEGWEFVMKLDSLSEMILHCHNDTCLFTAAFSGSREIPVFNRISYDGGDTWIDIDEIYPRIFKHNSNTLHRFIVEGNQRYYERSYDFFKTSEKYPAVNIPYDEKELMESPIDTNILISSHLGSYDTHWATIVGMAAQISRNAGKNWERLNLYNYHKGYTLYRFNFDWAEKGHWFYRADDGFDDLEYIKLPPKYFETFDDGLNFREIKFDPTDNIFTKCIIGLDGKYSTRSFVFNQYRYKDSITKFYRYYHSYNGIIVSNYDTIITHSKNINWLKLIDPTKPNTNLDSGYVFSLNPLNFQFDYSNYSNQIIEAYERTDFDIQKYSSNDFNTYLNKSQSLGNSWDLINNTNNKPRIRNTNLDQANKYLWILTFDDTYVPFQNDGEYQGSFNFQRLPWYFPSF